MYETFLFLKVLEDITMPGKSTYEELDQKVKKLEKELTKRKQADEGLYQGKEKYRNIISSIEEGYYEVDLEGNLIFFNDSLCNIYGYARDELMGMNNREYMTTETAKKTYEIFSRVYKTGEPTKIFDWEFIKKDNTKVDVEISVSLIKNTKEQAVGFRGIVRDIRERKRIEAALQKAHNELLEANMELEVKTNSLEEANTALKVILEKRDEDKVEIEERLLLNINEMILPYLEKLRKSRSNELQQSYADILESNLKEITSPFYQKMASDYYHLTPKEIQIAGLIKQGKTTKEIAELIQSSPRAIEFHRNNLRKKFGLTNTKTNLMTHLLTLN